MASKLAETIVEAVTTVWFDKESGPLPDESVRAACVVDRILAEHKIELRPMEELPYDGQIVVYWADNSNSGYEAIDANGSDYDVMDEDIGWLPLSRFDLGGDERE